MRLTDLFISMRPRQWTKNLVVFAAIIFVQKLSDPYLFRLCLQGFAALFAGFQIGDFGFFKGQPEFVDLPEMKIQFSGDFFKALGGIGAKFCFQRARW